MHHVAFLAVALVWLAASVLLWSWKQEQVILFLESLGMGALALATLYWQFTRPAK